MLILTRKLGETINIGENVEVKVLRVRGSQVQLGISAPPEIKVMRQEIVGKEFSPSCGPTLPLPGTADHGL
jgi:carbon storage regulator